MAVALQECSPLPPTLPPHPVDVHVGSRLRLARRACGRSQEALGQSVGVSAQQIQKYECGTNRISASTLFRFSGFVHRPIDWFFEGLEATGSASDRPDPLATLMASDEGALIANLMARLSPAMRRRVLGVIRALPQ